MNEQSIGFGEMEDDARRLNTGDAPFFSPPQDTADPNTLFECMKDRAVVYDPKYQVYYDPVQEVCYDPYSRSIQPYRRSSRNEEQPPSSQRSEPAPNVSP